MTEARERSEWGRLSALMALVANAHRDPKRHVTVRPEQFNPYAGSARSGELSRRRRPKAPLSILRDVFCRGSRKELNRAKTAE